MPRRIFEQDLTHHTIYDRVLAKQDDFSRGADQPFSVLLGAFASNRREILCQLLDRTRNRIHSLLFDSDVALLGRGRELNSSSFE